MKTVSKDKLIELLEAGNLCGYCSYIKEGPARPLREGSFCEDAKDNYVEYNELEVI